MPRTCGVSTTSTVWLMRRRPMPRTVSRCACLQPMMLFASVTFIFLSAMLPLSARAQSAVIAGDRARFSDLSADDLFHRLAALGGHLGGSVHLLQPVQRGADHVVGIGRPEALRQHVGDAHHLEHCPHRAAGDDSGTVGGRLHEYPGSPMLA